MYKADKDIISVASCVSNIYHRPAMPDNAEKCEVDLHMPARWDVWRKTSVLAKVEV